MCTERGWQEGSNIASPHFRTTSGNVPIDMVTQHVIMADFGVTALHSSSSSITITMTSTITATNDCPPRDLGPSDTTIFVTTPTADAGVVSVVRAHDPVIETGKIPSNFSG